MAHRSPLLSPASMAAIARDLGVSDIVDREGWGGVPAAKCGSVVRVCVQFAERELAAGARPRPTPSAVRPRR